MIRKIQPAQFFGLDLEFAQLEILVLHHHTQVGDGIHFDLLGLESHMREEKVVRTLDIVQPTIVIGGTHQGSLLVGHTHRRDRQSIGVNDLNALSLGGKRNDQE